VVGIALLADAFVRGGAEQGLLLAPWVLLGAWLVYAVMYAPHVATDAEGITVANVLRRTHVPWGRVTDISLRWQLVLTLDDGRRIKAYGGPVAGRPGRPTRAGDLRREPPALQDLVLVREPWELAREGGAAGGEMTRRWDLPALLSLAVILVWALIAVLIVQAGA
jgi:hypothetical protein